MLITRSGRRKHCGCRTHWAQDPQQLLFIRAFTKNSQTINMQCSSCVHDFSCVSETCIRVFVYFVLSISVSENLSMHISGQGLQQAASSFPQTVNVLRGGKRLPKSETNKKLVVLFVRCFSVRWEGLSLCVFMFVCIFMYELTCTKCRHRYSFRRHFASSD